MIKMVYVRWIDSGISLLGNVWQTKEEIQEIVENNEPTETVGMLIHEDHDWIVVAQTINGDQYRGGYCIYKQNIMHMEELVCERLIATKKETDSEIKERVRKGFERLYKKEGE